MKSRDVIKAEIAEIMAEHIDNVKAGKRCESTISCAEKIMRLMDECAFHWCK